MYATVVDVDGDDVVLEVAPGVEVRYMRRAIMDVVASGEDTEPDAEPDSEPEDEVQDEVEDREDADASAQAPAESGSTKKD